MKTQKKDNIISTDAYNEIIDRVNEIHELMKNPYQFTVSQLTEIQKEVNFYKELIDRSVIN